MWQSLQAAVGKDIKPWQSETVEQIKLFFPLLYYQSKEKDQGNQASVVPIQRAQLINIDQAYRK